MEEFSENRNLQLINVSVYIVSKRETFLYPECK